MTEKRFTIESERIGSTYSIHIFKDDEVIFEISNWNSLSNMHKKECEEFVDYLNSITNENEQLKSKNRGLQSELQIFKEDVTHSNLQISKLTDENEQLKQQLADIDRLIYDLGHDEMRRQYEEIFKGDEK